VCCFSILLAQATQVLDEAAARMTHRAHSTPLRDNQRCIEALFLGAGPRAVSRCAGTTMFLDAANLARPRAQSSPKPPTIHDTRAQTTRSRAPVPEITTDQRRYPPIPSRENTATCRNF
jgi:hypothetical protein